MSAPLERAPLSNQRLPTSSQNLMSAQGAHSIKYGIFGWCVLQSNRFVGVDNLLVTLEDPEDHRASW